MNNPYETPQEGPNSEPAPLPMSSDAPPPVASPGQPAVASKAPIGNTENRKLITGLCAILLGHLGVHKFLLGYTTEGIIMLVGTLVVGTLTCGIGVFVTWVIGIIEGIMYLTKTDAEFDQTYIHGRKPWF